MFPFIESKMHNITFKETQLKGNTAFRQSLVKINMKLNFKIQTNEKQ